MRKRLELVNESLKNNQIILKNNPIKDLDLIINFKWIQLTKPQARRLANALLKFADGKTKKEK